MKLVAYTPGPYEPGPQGDDQHGFCSVRLVQAVALAILLLTLLAGAIRGAKPPTDVGRCPKCGRSYWDCACPTDE